MDLENNDSKSFKSLNKNNKNVYETELLTLYLVFVSAKILRTSIFSHIS